MTKEQLEEKIKNNESVWVVCNNSIIEITPNEVENIIIFNISKKIEVIWDKFHIDYYKYDNIFNTRAQAQHYLANGNVVRNEKLPYITWEEVDRVSTYSSDGCYYINFKDINGNEIHFVSCCEGDYISITKYSPLGCRCLFNEDYTEENFYKAYDIARKLFKGEEI